MHAPALSTPTIPDDLIRTSLGRLGAWESSVERPSWSIPGQQLGLANRGPLKFTVHADQPEQLLRFRSYSAERQFWLEQLPTIDNDPHRLSRFRLCGAWSYVVRDVETGHLFLRAESCKLRICPACRRRIQQRAADRVLAFMGDRPDEKWQFQTFTLKHRTQPLKQQIDRLVACFRRLRHRKLWKDSVRTGYACIEVTFHPKDSLATGDRIREHSEWHPHLHVLAATEFIDWSLLRKAWLQITGDSDNIDCQHVRSSTHAAHYVAKYIGKPPNLNLRAEPERAAEYYRALQHRRLLMPFGATAKHKPPQRPPLAPTELVCRFEHLLEAARNNNYPAQAMLTKIMLATVPKPIVAKEPQRFLFRDAEQ